jgi:hypothetical protein
MRTLMPRQQWSLQFWWVESLGVRVCRATQSVKDFAVLL